MVSEPPLRQRGFFFNELHALAHRETLISGKAVKEMNYPPKAHLKVGPVNR